MMLHEQFLKALISFLIVANPLGVSAVFVGLMAFAEPTEVRRTATKAALVAAAVLCVFGLFGQPLLAKFGITIAAFRVSGGILLFTIAYKMLFGDQLPEAQHPDRRALSEKADIAVFPLGIPLIAGPGCITLSIIMMAKTETRAESVVTMAGMLLAILATWLCLLSARYLKRAISASGMNLITRIMGVLLAARSVQIIADGIQGLRLFNM